MYNYVFYQTALKDYQEAIAWYEERSEEAAERFITSVKNRIDTICSDPFRYRNMHRKFHEVSVLNFPYTIVYLIKKKDGVIIISSIYHHKRNPKKKYRQ